MMLSVADLESLFAGGADLLEEYILKVAGLFTSSQTWLLKMAEDNSQNWWNFEFSDYFEKNLVRIVQKPDEETETAEAQSLTSSLFCWWDLFL